MRHACDLLSTRPIPDAHRRVDAGCGEIASVRAEGDAVRRAVVPEMGHLVHAGQLPYMSNVVVPRGQVVAIRAETHPVRGIVSPDTHASEFLPAERVPEAYRALLARGGKEPPVPAECNGDRGRALRHVGHLVSRRGVEHADSAVTAACGEQAAIPAESHRIDVITMGDAHAFGAAWDIPLACGTIIAGGRQDSAIRAEGHALDATAMLETGNLRAA